MISECLVHRDFVPTHYVVRLARNPWERAGHYALRRAVFCEEQRVFEGDDRDSFDNDALPIIAAYCSAGMPDHVVGAVRIHQSEPGIWRGSRLAVHRDHRKLSRIGAELIRMAVCTANGLGAERFFAQVQAQNVLLFRRLHWRSLNEITLHGLPHHEMEANLSRYPAHGESQTSFLRPQPQTRAA